MNPLPPSGPAKEIFVRALREFSDSCQPPALKPTCPFSTETHPGVRGCGEECMDLLASFESGEAAERTEVSLGDGIALRPRHRARRGPDPSARAFDASELRLLDDDEKDVTKWRTVSLISELRKQAVTSPTLDADRRAARLERLGECFSELDRRGFDAELVLREGLGLAIAVSIGIAVVMPEVIRSDNPDAPEVAELEAPEGWLDLFELVFAGDSRSRLLEANVPPEAARLVGAIRGEFHRRLASWTMNAPLREVMEWSAPTCESILAFPAVDLSAARRPHEWLVARFLTTYLNDWPTFALHYEWEWVHARRLPPCPTKEMAIRRIDVDELGRVVAERAVNAGAEMSDPAQSSASSLTANDYVPYAVSAIKDGRRSVATSLFQATVELAPGSADAQNNFGFCILLDRPNDALAAFEEATRLGDDSARNAGNRMLALIHLGRPTTALEVAERFARRYSEVPRHPGWMWSPTASADEPELLDLDDVRAYVLDLAVLIAEQAGDDALADRWRARRAALAEGV